MGSATSVEGASDPVPSPVDEEETAVEEGRGGRVSQPAPATRKPNTGHKSIPLGKAPDPKTPAQKEREDELSGLTLSLLLRDYCEFTGMTNMFINVALIVCFILLVRYESYGAQTGTLSYDTINKVSTSPATKDPFESIQSAAAYTCTTLQSVVSDSITNNLRPESNDIAFGTRALLRAVEVEFFLPSSSAAAEEVNVKYIGACNEPGSCSTAADCIAAKTMLCSNSTGFEDIYSFFVDAQIRRKGSSIVVFDTRNPSTTTASAQAHINTMCSSILPALLPFTSIVIFHAHWQSYVEESAQTISEVKIGLLRPAQATILSSSSFYVIPTSIAVYPANVWEPVRTLLEFIFVIAVLIEIFYELEEFAVSYGQNAGHSCYASDRWNRIDWVAFIFTLTVFFFKWGFAANGDMSGSDVAAHSPRAFAHFVRRAYNVTVWRYSVLIAMAVFSLRLFKYFRYHGNLRMYIRFLKYLWAMAQGFLVVFTIVVICFASIFWGIYTLSGGNNLFFTFGSSVNTILRVVFNFSDYDTFVNHGYGLGNFSFISVLLFWCCVVSFPIISQNIMIAIVGNAHDQARRPEEDFPNVFEYIQRLYSFLTKIRAMQIFFYVTSCRCCSWRDARKRARKLLLLGLGGGEDGEDKPKPGFIYRTINFLFSLGDYKEMTLEYRWDVFEEHNSILARLEVLFVNRSKDRLSFMHFDKLCALPKDFPLLINKDLVSLAAEDVVKALEKAEKLQAGKKKAPAGNGSDTWIQCFVSNEEEYIEYWKAKKMSKPKKNEEQQGEKSVLWLKVGSIEKSADVIEITLKRIKDERSLKEHTHNHPTPSPLSQKAAAAKDQDPDLPELSIDFFTTLTSSDHFEKILKMVSKDEGIDKCVHPLARWPSFEKVDDVHVSDSAKAIFEAYQFSALSKRDIHKKRVRQKLRSLYQLVDDHVSDSRNVGSGAEKDCGYKNSISLKEVKMLRKEVREMKLLIEAFIEQNKK